MRDWNAQAPTEILPRHAFPPYSAGITTESRRLGKKIGESGRGSGQIHPTRGPEAAPATAPALLCASGREQSCFRLKQGRQGRPIAEPRSGEGIHGSGHKDGFERSCPQPAPGLTATLAFAPPTAKATARANDDFGCRGCRGCRGIRSRHPHVRARDPQQAGRQPKKPPEEVRHPRAPAPNEKRAPRGALSVIPDRND